MQTYLIRQLVMRKPIFFAGENCYQRWTGRLYPHETNYCLNMFDNLIIIVITRHYGHSSAQSDVKYARGKTNTLITRCGAELLTWRTTTVNHSNLWRLSFSAGHLINKNTYFCCECEFLSALEFHFSKIIASTLLTPFIKWNCRGAFEE